MVRDRGFFVGTHNAVRSNGAPFRHGLILTGSQVKIKNMGQRPTVRVNTKHWGQEGEGGGRRRRGPLEQGHWWECGTIYMSRWLVEVLGLGVRGEGPWNKVAALEGRKRGRHCRGWRRGGRRGTERADGRREGGVRRGVGGVGGSDLTGSVRRRGRRVGRDRRRCWT
jgi:hypothetical protein